MMVSIYSNIKDTAGQEMALPAILAGIRQGQWREAVERVRAAPTDSSEQKALKELLPNFTGSGTFRAGRADKDIITHSHLLWMDFDTKDNPDAELLTRREELAADPYTRYLYVSCRGEGFAVAVPIDPKRHRETFGHLMAYYKQRYGLTADRRCKNEGRVRFVSYDPDLFENPDALTYTIRGYLKTDLEATIAKIEGASVDLTTDYADWIRIGFALAHECGEAGRDYFHRLSRFHAKYDEGACDKKYTSCLKQQGSSKATIATFYYLCQQAGIAPVRTMAAELTYQVRQAKRAGTQPDRVIAGLVAGRGLNKDDVETLVNEVYNDELKTITGFWHVEYDAKKERRSITVPRERWKAFLTDAGFRLVTTSAKPTLARIEGQIVRPVKDYEIKHYVVDEYLASLPFEFYGRPAEDGELPAFYQLYRTEVIDRVMVTEALFKESQLGFLPALPQDALVRDTATEARFFYNNCWVSVTAQGVTPRPYEELPGLVWAEQVRPRGFEVPFVDEMGDFGTFIQRITAGSPERFNALRRAMGYYLHGFKDAAIKKAVILCDEAVSVAGEPNGGTGKSLVFHALGHLVPVCVIDGKGYDERNDKALQRVTAATRILFFDDLEGRKVRFDRFFNMISDGLVVNRHYLGEEAIPYDRSPKLGFAINDTFASPGESHARRKVEIEIAAHYSSRWTPLDEFKRRFFDDWNATEWQRFDAFMLDSCRLFLAHGLPGTTSINLNRRKTAQMTGGNDAFIAFMDEQPREHPLAMADLRRAFREQEGIGEHELAHNKFTSWVNAYAAHYGIQITSETVYVPALLRKAAAITIHNK